MTNELVRTKLERTLQVKSLTDLIRTRSSEEVLLLLDISGSMGPNHGLMRNGKSKIEGLREVVQDIQKQRPVKMITFGGEGGGARKVSAVPDVAQGGTPLHDAINLAREEKAGRAVVVSDGQPDNASRALDAAKSFGGRIDVIYVGNPGGPGESFLKMLAESTGGTEFHGDLSEPKELGAKISGLLTGESDEDDEQPRKAVQL